MPVENGIVYGPDEIAKKTDFRDNEEVAVVGFAKLNGGWKDDALVLDKLVIGQSDVTKPQMRVGVRLSSGVREASGLFARAYGGVAEGIVGVTAASAVSDMQSAVERLSGEQEMTMVILRSKHDPLSKEVRWRVVAFFREGSFNNAARCKAAELLDVVGQAQRSCLGSPEELRENAMQVRARDAKLTELKNLVKMVFQRTGLSRLSVCSGCV